MLIVKGELIAKSTLKLRDGSEQNQGLDKSKSLNHKNRLLN